MGVMMDRGLVVFAATASNKPRIMAVACLVRPRVHMAKAETDHRRPALCLRLPPQRLHQRPRVRK